MNDIFRRFWFLLCAIPYLGFWSYGLTDLDEGFYGAVSMDMLRRGDWITPTLNGIPWFEKPILSYWLSIPILSVLPNEFGARLPSFLCTMATCFVVYKFTAKHVNTQTAILAALIYSTNLLTVGIGRLMMTDAPLVLCLTLAFTTFYESIHGNEPQRLWTAVCLGLATLAKGPVALVLFAIIAAFTFWRLPQTRQNWRKFWLIGTLIILVIVAAWAIPCYQANGQLFIDKFLIEQNIGRFKGGDVAHTIPGWANPIFFPVVLAASFLFWLIPAIKSKFWQTPTPVSTFLLIWAVTVAIFFSISGSKLVHYVLPATPALAILIASAMIRRAGSQSETKFPPQALGAEVEESPNQALPNNTKIAAIIATLATLTIAQIAISSDWNRRFKDPQSLAIYARNNNLQLYEANLGRPEDAKTDISLSLNDTGHPSLGFYYRRPIGQIDLSVAGQTIPPNSLIIIRDFKSQVLQKTITRGRYTGVISN
jgi:4-amino-4-deoxy-L-arabinose transferase-like glycosyltransferase